MRFFHAVSAFKYWWFPLIYIHEEWKYNTRRNIFDRSEKIIAGNWEQAWPLILCFPSKINPIIHRCQHEKQPDSFLTLRRRLRRMHRGLMPVTKNPRIDINILRGLRLFTWNKEVLEKPFHILSSYRRAQKGVSPCRGLLSHLQTSVISETRVI